MKNPKILIAEDSPTLTLNLSSTLKSNTYEIVYDKDVEECLVLEHLPKINGFEATKLITGLGRNIPVIAQTAFAMSREEQKCYNVGCIDYISKPIISEILLN